MIRKLFTNQFQFNINRNLFINFQSISNNQYSGVTINKRNYCNHGFSNNNNTLTEQQSNIRVRYAPSPTGSLHLGGLRTALFNYLFAKKNNGTFILRIEDTDQSRLVQGSAKNLEDCLNWAGVSYDEGPNKPGECGPYTQSQRLPIYKEYAQKLVDSGHAYHCFCSSERLNSSRINLKNKHSMSLYDRHCLKLTKEEVDEKLKNNESHTIRLKIPSEKVTKFYDLVKGKVQFQNQLIDDQVLMKSDGFPTYHLASVVDDHLMGISHVIRGEEWLNSAPKHIILYEAFGWKPPQMCHVPLLLNSDKSKLSKRQGDVSVDAYIAKGYLPQALVNFVSLLGWTPPTNNTNTNSNNSNTTQQQPSEILLMKDLIDKFSLEDLNKSGSVVNLDRLDWINVQHIRMLMDGQIDKEMLEQVYNDLLKYPNQEILDQKLVNDKEYLEKTMQCVKERVHLVQDFLLLILPFYFRSINYTTDDAKKMKLKVWKNDSYENMQKLIEVFENLQEFSSSNIYNIILKQSDNNTTVSNQLMSNLRYLLLGTPVGGGIPVSISILGKESTIQRLKRGLELNK
ncbi:glutamate-tRNA ligase [Tieghemostelium lacteum]|uniref:glutamate--tRNA ligase n=1 Tax=Tieghemostelium lacteum TaxID=361077 RepID=A0A151Z2S6_TIELA|nr:glutamate-tRNA ligase [Tieghemostelium lacteum]|eukprot:KYQ88262.1 glutamate-tRNA ligase [Tieghemostelium lacteum]